MHRLKIFTWHVHGSYLFNLTQAPHDFFVPVREGRPEGYGGRGGNFAWPDNLIEVPAECVREMDFDLILYQSTKNYVVDQFDILSPAQRELPAVYLEHNTPRPHPTDTKHVVDDPRVLVVHCTYFNQIMWNCGRTPTAVVEHGVMVPEQVQWQGDLARGIVVVNGLGRRGRLAGLDVFQRARELLPIDIAGMESELYGGVGDLPHHELHLAERHYRFFFNPIRYTSLPLALLEAMAIGLPIVALATTELPRAVPHDDAGFVSNNYDELLEGMERLLGDHALARRMGTRAREIARTHYGIRRFVDDWNRVFFRVVNET